MVVVLACVVAAVVWPREREPEYKGKRLSEWLGLYHEQIDVEGVDFRSELRDEAEAVHHIGTNALPWLLRWVRYEPPAWRIKVYSFMNMMPRALQNDFLMNRDPFRYQQYNLALTGFSILGERASPAVPELARLVNDPTAPELVMR